MLVFGGVVDYEQHHHKVDSIFYNDLTALDIERRKWFALRIKEKKSGGGRRRRAKSKATDDDEQEEDSIQDEDDNASNSSEIEEEEEIDGNETTNTGWNIDMLRQNMFAFVDGDGNIIYEKIEESDEEGEEKIEKEKEETKEDEEEEEAKEEEEEKEDYKPTSVKKSVDFKQKKITSSSVMMLNSETNSPEAVEREEPLPRINPSLLVHGNMMYLLGGILEVGDREVTMDDFWALDLRKREKWDCLWKGSMHTQVWRGAAHDDDDSYISTGREDDSDDDFSDDEGEGLGVHDIESKKSQRKSKRVGLREEIAKLNETHQLEDSNRTPNTGESLADYYSRTSEYWNVKAAEVVATTSEELSNKELKREGFKLAKDRFEELKPILNRLAELSLESKPDKQDKKSTSDKKSKKSSRR
jgi:hypothetical protein